jgi:hypothetical protein
MSTARDGVLAMAAALGARAQASRRLRSSSAESSQLQGPGSPRNEHLGSSQPLTGREELVERRSIQFRADS